MNTKLIKSVFSDDPDIMVLMAARDQEELVKKINEKPEPEIAVLIRGPMGDKPVAGVDYPIPKDGKDYILTAQDKEEIATKVQVEIPVVEKVIEKHTEVVRELPQVTEVTKKEEMVLTEDTAREIVKLMRKLPEKDRLEIQDIRNSNSFIFSGNKYKIEELMHGGAGPTPSGSLVFTYDISSQFDGVATTFTIPAYYSILSFTLTGWPPEGNLRPTTDFTTPTSTTIALTSQVTAPQSGTTGIVLYTV